MGERDDPPFPIPRLHGAPDADGWIEEVSRYVVRPRPKPKFRSVLPTSALLSEGRGEAVMRMRVRPDAGQGERVYEVHGEQRLGRDMVVHETLTCIRQGDGIVAEGLERQIGDGRLEKVRFHEGPFPWPAPTYPEVMLPFVMRGVPHDGARRALYSWTNDRFCARVYAESRGSKTLELPVGRVEAVECWMYPDLNDWIALGRVITKLAKPMLPRYDMHFEVAAPHRVLRFEGPYGPPGAPEVLIELVE